MSVSTVYVNSNAYRFSQNHEQGGSWSDKWSAAVANGYGIDTNVRASVYRGGGSFDIYRTTQIYDTSVIPSNATIHSATWNAYVKKVHDGDCSNSIIYLCPVSATGNSAGYYNKSYFGTYLAYLDKQNVESDNVNEWWQPNIDVSAIVKAGNTILGLRHYQDYNNSAPWNDGTGEFWFAPTNDATYKPYLSIYWTTPPATTSGLFSNLTPQYVTISGEVTDIGGGTVTSRGICWSKSENPTTSDSKAISSGQSGSFSVLASNLIPGTRYHYRSFVVTENSTQYGADLTFTTPSGALFFSML